MRKLLISGLAVASLTGIAYAQVERSPDTLATRCLDASGIAHKIGETATVGNTKFQCVRTFGDGMKPKGADWVVVQPTVYSVTRSF